MRPRYKVRTLGASTASTVYMEFDSSRTMTRQFGCVGGSVGLRYDHAIMIDGRTILFTHTVDGDIIPRPGADDIDFRDISAIRHSIRAAEESNRLWTFTRDMNSRGSQ